MKTFLMTALLLPSAALASNPEELICRSYQQDFNVEYTATVERNVGEVLTRVKFKFSVGEDEPTEGEYEPAGFTVDADKSFSLKAVGSGEGVAIDALRRGRNGDIGVYQGWASMLKTGGAKDESLFDFPVICWFR